MKKLKLLSLKKPTNKGQSFMEMTVVLGVLLLLLIGMVEFGYLLNQYITLVDGVREGARFGSSGKVDPYIRTTAPFVQNAAFFEGIDCVIEGTHGQNCPSVTISKGALEPIVLDPATDDLIITFYRVVNHGVNQTFGPWHRYGTMLTPKITQSVVEHSLSINSAPDSGVLVVEVFYNHHQLVSFPIIADVIPDPLQVHTYAIMPLARAKPTPSGP